MFHKIINLTLRFGGVGSKFVLLILLSKFLATDVYGKFNLIATTVTIMIYLIGIDFYNYAIRDILTNKKDKLSKLVNTFSLYFIIYIVFFIVLYFINGYINFLSEFYILFFIISITEHLSQEVYRFQIAFKKITFANTLLFLRVFGYSSTIILFYIFEKKLDVNFILKIWALFNTIIVLISLFDLFKNWNGKINLNKSWLNKGIKTSLYFFIATIFLKLIEYSNRYIIAFFLTDYDVGIFSFYSNVAIIITVYVNTIVTSYKLPILIENSYSQKVKQILNKTNKELYLQSFLSFILSAFIMLIFLYWQDKIEYRSNINLYLFLGFASIITNVSLIYYFNLFIHNQEKRIMVSTVKSGVLGIIVTIVFIYLWGLMGAAIAAVISAFFLFYFRRVESKKLQLW